MKKYLLIYYALLLLVLCAWTSPALPPLALRLVYFVAVLLPVFKRRDTNYPAILSMFVIISANRIAPSFMPFMPNYLLAATLVMLLGLREKAAVRPPLPLYLMLFVTLVSSVVFSHTVDAISLILAITILFFFFINENLLVRRREMAVSILIAVTVLALESLIYGNSVATSDILVVDEKDRTGWSDPNYFSHLLGMGALVALQLIVTGKDLSQRIRYILMGLLFVFVLVMFQVASRGGLISLGGAAVTLALLSVKKDSNAGRILLILGLFVLAMYAMGAFDIMSARVENEDETELGGRSLVWASKFVEFTNQAGPLDWLFGIGRDRAQALANYLSPGEIMGFHNDYLAVLFSYGIVGLLAFLFMLLYPLFKFKNACVTSGIVFLSLFSMTLEPFGGLNYCYFYFYLYILGASYRYENWLTQEIAKLFPEEETACTILKS